MTKFFLPFLLTFLMAGSCNQKPETAQWISCREGKDTTYGVFSFRNEFKLDKVPDSLILAVSADNRYKLFVNNIEAGLGPSRGSLDHWNYERYDIAPYLQAGNNVIEALVWNAGKERPFAQISLRTGFYLASRSSGFESLNTGSGNWKTREIKAYHPVNFGIFVDGKYYVCGPGDSLRMDQYPETKLTPATGEFSWKKPAVIPQEEAKWNLVPRIIPPMESLREDDPDIVRVNGNLTGSGSVSLVTLPVTIPPNSSTSILFDQGYLTVGYPELRFSGGREGKVKITYAETLVYPNGRKGNRNEIEGKVIRGYYDVILPDGRKNFRFTPLWLRTFRYVQIDIDTGDEPLDLLGFSNVFSAYPLTPEAQISTDDPVTDPLMQTGWRTLRLCAGETFFDCPYYEQLQYIGDTRVESLISLYLSHDDRLVQKAIKQFGYSLRPDGLTLSRFPAREDQIIPPFSLYWVSMLYDYYMLRQNDRLVRDHLDGIKSVLGYFHDYINDLDMLGPMPHGDTVGGGLPEFWYFEDWSWGFSRGIPQGVYDNSSSIISLHYANTLQQAAVIMDGLGETAQAASYRETASLINRGVMEHCFDPARGYIAQTPDKKLFSQHANILAVLSGAIPENQQKKLMQQTVSDKSLIQCSMYFQFYLFEAMKKAGLGDEYLDHIGFWYRAMENGLTTFPEKEGNTRSDCHGWNASPCYEMFANVAGIEPSSPGFKTVTITPRLGHLKHIEAMMPHPEGTLAVSLKKDEQGQISGTIKLPAGVSGVFCPGDQNIQLQPGENRIR